MGREQRMGRGRGVLLVGSGSSVFVGVQENEFGRSVGRAFCLISTRYAFPVGVAPSLTGSHLLGLLDCTFPI
jgi:hypothetical protein